MYIQVIIDAKSKIQALSAPNALIKKLIGQVKTKNIVLHRI